MPIMFNTILVEVGLSLADVRLLRYKDQRAAKGRSIYELWRDARQQFDLYQSTQKIVDRTKLSASYWASFLGTPSNETMFAGLYHVKYRGLLEQETPTPHMDDVTEEQVSKAIDYVELGQGDEFPSVDDIE